MQLQVETAAYGHRQLEDMALGKKIMDTLEKYYPLHAWFVNASHDAGTYSVQLMYEGKQAEMRVWKYGFLGHIGKLISDDLDKKIMKVGGEVLERYNMARKAATENDLIDFMHRGIETGNMINQSKH
jgi:hypothetical protein